MWLRILINDYAVLCAPWLVYFLQVRKQSRLVLEIFAAAAQRELLQFLGILHLGL